MTVFLYFIYCPPPLGSLNILNKIVGLSRQLCLPQFKTRSGCLFEEITSPTSICSNTLECLTTNDQMRRAVGTKCFVLHGAFYFSLARYFHCSLCLEVNNILQVRRICPCEVKRFLSHILRFFKGLSLS